MAVSEDQSIAKRDIAAALGKAVATIDFEGINEKLESINNAVFEAGNYLQISLKYKKVPPKPEDRGKPGQKSDRSIEIIVYDFLKLGLNLNVFKAEVERAKPVSHKIPIQLN